jgi:hypothetical protein
LVYPSWRYLTVAKIFGYFFAASLAVFMLAAVANEQAKAKDDAAKKLATRPEPWVKRNIMRRIK